MNKKNVLFIWFAMALAIAGFAAGNAEKGSAAPEKITIKFSHFWTEADGDAGIVVKQRVEEWMKANPGVTVETELMSHDEYYEKFRVRATAKSLPDVFIMNADMTTPASNAGLVMDITAAFNADAAWKATVVPGLLDEWTRAGKIYALPSQVIMTHQIYYNKKIFAEVGINEFPDTWAGLLTAVKKLSSAGYIPIAMGASGGWPLFDCVFGTLSFRATGVQWYNDLLQKKAAFTDPEFLRALSAYDELVKAGAFNKDATSIDNMQARTLYYNRKASMFIEGGWAIAGALDQQEVEADTDIALWPALPNGLGEANEVTWASGWGWAANNQLSGAKKEAAISLLKALSDEAYGKARIERGLGTPQKVSGYDASKLPRLFVLEDKYAQNWKAVPILTLGFPAAVTDVLSIGLQEITVGITDPATVAKKVQAEYIKQ